MHNNEFNFLDSNTANSSSRYGQTLPLFSAETLRPVKPPKRLAFKSLADTKFKLEEETKTVKFKTAGLS